ncbi:MAG: hypothetical protein REI78_00430 [Pedobacter sp.]|nr:hypothetical protein [Pedobacter sp.]MDQ8051452.1 hypothetical protein [Pedobacter sp.]
MKKLIFSIIITMTMVNFAKAQDYSFHWGNMSPSFNNGAANQVAYIDFGDVGLWGYVEITLTSSFNNQLTTGMYGKRFNVGKNTNWSFYANSSEVFVAFRPVAEQWKLGEFQVDGTNHLVLPIFHLVSSGNAIHVNINGVSLAPINESLIQITTAGTLPNTETRDYQHTLDPVAIGTKKIDPSAKLTVGGKVSAREIKVDVNAGADFVFNPNYGLLNLAALKTYIQAHKHLPDIPSASKMVKEGLEVGEFQLKLLQKIEELTLYLLEKEAQVKALEKRVSQLEGKN